VVGGATGAAMTAIVMSFEMTRDYNVVIPMTITVALSYGVRKALCKESIYTMKLARRGHYIPEALEVNISHIRQARDVMDKNVASVPASLTLGEFGQIASAKKASWFLVEDSNKVIGVIARSGISEMSGRLERTATLAEIADKYFVVAAQETKLLDVFASMCASRVSLALIIRGGEEETVTPDNVMGVITGRKLRDVIRSEDELFSD
jgi:CIC family chloride channel protein